MDNYGQMVSDSTAWPLESSHLSEHIIKDAIPTQVTLPPPPFPNLPPIHSEIETKMSLLPLSAES
jgi:hypothetical protein